MIVKKSYFILLFVLCGCVQYPNYISHIQRIDLGFFYEQNPGVKIFYDNGEEPIGEIELFRSWFDKELVIKKKGFKDYHLKLESVWTDDAWARRQTCVGMCGGGPGIRKITFPELIIPYNTAMSLLFPIFLPWGISSDVVGIVSAPILPLWNPWKEYNSDFIHYKHDYLPGAERGILVQPALEPTEELRKSCNQKGYFISNLGCMKCSYDRRVIASQKENDKCPNRVYGKEVFSHYTEGLYYSYSCDDDTLYYHTNDCLKCPNRYDDGDGICRLCKGQVSKDGKSCIN